MRSVMNYSAGVTPSVDIPRSVFNRSCGYKTTLKASRLIPFYWDEVLPGDSFRVSTTMLLRFNDLLRPFMDNLFLDVFYFFVPYRLVWPHFQNMCGEQENPGDPTDYMIPQVNFKAEDRTPESISDYFGIPQGGQDYLASGYKLVGTMQDGVYTPSGFSALDSDQVTIGYDTAEGLALRNKTISVSALPFRAYNLIWNEWFRDENLQDQVEVPKGDGPDDSSLYTILRRDKRHDYFTSCLPWPQKGPQVTIPIGSQAPVLSNTNSVDSSLITPFKLFDDSGALMANSTVHPDVLNLPGNSSNGQVVGRLFDLSSGSPDRNVNLSLYADLAQASATSINELREAFAIQRMFERDARSGTRYTEILQSHFKVINPDLRLQRPEFLSHSSERIRVTQVPQTSASTSDSPQGNLSAISLTDVGSGYQHSFGEYGVVIGLVCVHADLTYQQGLDRILSKRTRVDLYWPELAHLGEQAVLNKEIFVSGSDHLNEDGKPVDDDVFGYMPRYDEYRFKKSLITGHLNSLSPLPLDQWHLSQKFENLPTLSSDFIQEDVPIDRVVAVKDQPPFLLDVYHSIKAARPLPVFGVPGMMDHY